MTAPARPIAIVSTSIPPAPTGQAAVLGRLLDGGTDVPVVLLSDMLDRMGEAPLPDGVRTIGLPAAAWCGKRSLLERASRSYAESRRSGGCSARERTPSRTASRRSGRRRWSAAPAAHSTCPRPLPPRADWEPPSSYLFDDPVLQWPDRRLKMILRFHERRWGPRSRRIIVPNEDLGEAMRSRCRRPFVVVRNPVDDDAFEMRDPPEGERDAGSVRIVYTGSVYSAQADAFRALIAALDAFAGRLELHVHTAQSAERLAQLDVAGRHVFRHDHAPWPGVGAIQRRADILFLPLAFDPGMRRLLRTASPGKLGEYLASGRPILVHAPADTFVCRFFRRHDCGTVVDRPDPALIVDALDRLARCGDGHRTANARRLAERFRAAAVRRDFWQAVLG